MNQCPDCESFIHYLVVRKMKGKVFIMEEHKKLYPNLKKDKDKGMVEQKEISISHYSCPECEYTIFEDDEIEAREWLEKI